MNRHTFITPRNLGSSLWLRGIVLALALTVVRPAFAWWWIDRTKPTTPTNFRVTAVTPFSVSLAWGPSSDNSGRFSYRLSSTRAGASSSQVTYLPKTATSYTWQTAIFPATGYTFRLRAIDEAGNASAEVTTSATTLPDTTAPSVAPVISVEFVNDTYVSLRWTAAVDDGPYLFYEVWVDGQPFAPTGQNRSITVESLEPETTYTFAVLASDLGENLSPFSAPVVVTTAPAGSVDTTPPTAPQDFELVDVGCGEVQLFWTQSTDDFDDPSLLRYDILVDGNLEHSVVGVGSATLVVQPTWLTVFDIYAVDTSGNQSRNATLDANLDGCP